MKLQQSLEKRNMYMLLKSPEVEDEEEGSHLNGARERGRGRRVPAAGPGPPQRRRAVGVLAPARLLSLWTFIRMRIRDRASVYPSLEYPARSAISEKPDMHPREPHNPRRESAPTRPFTIL